MRSLRGRNDDEGSLPLAMLVVVIGLGISVLVLTTVVRGAVDTNTALGHSTALLAARTGLASGLASLRAAVNDSDAGSIPALPCSSPGTAQLTGTMDNQAGSYATTVWYLTNDPSRRNEAWVQANSVTCATQLPRTPRWAYIVSAGVSADGKYRRTLMGTYQFKLRAMGNSPGGQIRVYRTPTATDDYCLTATSPTAGTRLTMSVCASKQDGTAVDRQKFGYMPNLTIRLVTADPAMYPNGLCADAGWPQAIGEMLRLRDCGLATQTSQQWAFDSASNFRGTTDGRTLNSFCWNIMSPDQTIALNDTSGALNDDSSRKCGITRTDYQSWTVTADAGSGAAGPDSGQLVNFRQFGKCLDFNYSGVNAWAFPCKQSPSIEFRDMSQVWNQVWTLPEHGANGLISVTKLDRTTTLCLKAPAAGQTRVTLDACPASSGVAREHFIWWMRGDEAATYDEKYRIEATGPWSGQCLAPRPAAGNPVQADWVEITSCTGDYLQKWNAVPPVSTSGLANVIER